MSVVGVASRGRRAATSKGKTERPEANECIMRRRAELYQQGSGEEEQGSGGGEDREEECKKINDD